MKRIVILLLAALSLSACLRYDINEVLLLRDDVSLTVKGKLQYVFISNQGQMSINADRTLYRYLSDDLKTWMEIKCQTRPGGVGDKFIADIKWNSSLSNGEEKDLDFEIKKTDGSGMIWLWNKSDNIGLVIRDFE